MMLPKFQHVFFAPWVGENYETAETLGRRRMLIMGESHYSWREAPEDRSKWTQCCVQTAIEGTAPFFWRSIARTVLGRDPSSADRSRFWNDVAFCNYVQESVGDGPNKKVTWPLLLAAQPAFRELLEALKPRTLLVFSRKAWTTMPREDEGGTSVSLNGATIETARYRIGDGSWMSAYSLKHPRAGLSPPVWHAALLKTLAEVA